MGEASEGVAARASGVHDGGDARVNPGEVGVNAGLVDAVIDVGVQVYESGYDQLAGDVYHAGVGIRDNIRGDPRNRAVRYGYVHLRVDALGRVYDSAAFEKKISHLRGLCGNWEW